MNFHTIQRPLDIAVIGSGIAGMSAAWLLSHRYNVTVYEKEARIGGHSNTVSVRDGSDDIPVDTGFIVYNERNYPNLTQLFDLLGVPTRPADMSFSVSADGGDFEYASTKLYGLLAQPGNLMRPRFWRMIGDILRFYREAPGFLSSPPDDSPSLGDFLRDGGYSDVFRRDHLLPMGAAIWSTPPARMLEYPAVAFLNFLDNHGLLSIGSTPLWRTVVGGSREYVRRLTARYAQNVQTAQGVRRVLRRPGGVTVETMAGTLRHHDHVVIAAHGDEALAMIRGDADPEERRILGAFDYQNNTAVLHSDTRLMPVRRRAWASWNYLRRSDMSAGDRVSITYWMNRLQSLETGTPMLLSLNPLTEPDEKSVHYRTEYSHPVFDHAAYRAQADIWDIQGRNRTWYCGAHLGYGFHEDGLQSGLAVAEALGGVKRPWRVENESGRLRLPAHWSASRLLEVAA